MKFERLLTIVRDEPVFESGLLLAGDVNAVDVRRQLSRWTQSGKIYQLRRGFYALAPPFQKRAPHPFLVANRLVRGSYVSCQSALAYYGLIPEYTPVVVSVTHHRPAAWETPLGSFAFRHVKLDLFFGYEQVDLPGGGSALIALPEKALLDLIYLQPGGDEPAYLTELRLHNLDRMDAERLERLASQTDQPKLKRAADYLRPLIGQQAGEYSRL
jgi:predicted transcriptional regulator of viral defense system